MDMTPTEIHGTEPKSALWSTTDLAGFLGCSDRQVYNLRKQGLPWLQVGGHVRFDPNAIRQWLGSNQSPEAGDDRCSQLASITTSGDEDNAECAAADLAREFPDAPH
jgi:phage terminase Nu1 subunit (DNA packaging protein)